MIAKFRDEDHFNLWKLESIDVQYGALADDILKYGTEEFDPDRTDDKWLTILDSSHKMHNTALNFPALLSKRTNIGAAIKEICWMVRGQTNIEELDSKIWDEWASEDGSIGWGYGRMMRALPDVKVLHSDNRSGTRFSDVEIERQVREVNRLNQLGYKNSYLGNGQLLLEGTIDQFLLALESIRARSRSRRIMVRTFNPAFLSLQNLPPCHTDITFNVTKARAYEKAQMEARGDTVSEDSLHISVHMRSSDVALGRPFNVAQYSALHHLLAIYCGLNIGSFCLSSTNTHIYSHHAEAMKAVPVRVDTIVKQALETNIVPAYPTMFVDPAVKELQPKELLDTASLDMFRWTDYNPLPHIPFRVTK